MPSISSSMPATRVRFWTKIAIFLGTSARASATTASSAAETAIASDATATERMRFISLPPLLFRSEIPVDHGQERHVVVLDDVDEADLHAVFAARHVDDAHLESAREVVHVDDADLESDHVVDLVPESDGESAHAPVK